MKLHFLSYADKRYQRHQNALVAEVAASGAFDTIHTYTRDWLVTTPFYEENKVVLDMPRGGGYWLWKPRIILETIDRAAAGDVIVYMDCGDQFRNIRYLRDALLYSVATHDIGVRIQGDLNRKMTKRDCFVKMNCDRHEYWNTKQIEAGLVVVKPTDRSVRIVNEWMEWCRDPAVVTDAANQCGLPNFQDFRDHRHDQSILTNLLVREGIPGNESFLCTYINGNIRFAE